MYPADIGGTCASFHPTELLADIISDHDRKLLAVTLVCASESKPHRADSHEPTATADYLLEYVQVHNHFFLWPSHLDGLARNLPIQFRQVQLVERPAAQLMQASVQIHTTEDLQTDSVSCLASNSAQGCDTDQDPGQT